MKKFTLSIVVICLSLFYISEVKAQKPLGATTAKSTTSYATTQQVATLESSVTMLTKRVDAIQARYEEVLSENTSLKNKLGDKVPLAHNESNGFVWEAVKAYRVGNAVMVEVVVTNTTDAKMSFGYRLSSIIVTDEFGGPAKEVDVINKNNITKTIYSGPDWQYNVVLFPNAPMKFDVKVTGLSSISNYIGSFAFAELTYAESGTRFDEDYTAVLLNIKID